jgi:hypothetical protein
VITIENGTLLVSLIGRFGDFPPTDKEGFIAFAKELHSDLAYRIIKDGEQLSPIAHQRFVSSVQRHYERMNPCPEQFVVICDALCHFNPIYAQGMSAAAKQAGILQEILSDCMKQSGGLEGVASSFFTRAAEFNRTPWTLAAGADFAFPQTRGVRPPGTAEQARYFAELDKLAQEDGGLLHLMIPKFSTSLSLFRYCSRSRCAAGCSTGLRADSTSVSDCGRRHPLAAADSAAAAAMSPTRKSAQCLLRPGRRRI